ncbi:MAG: hypothetical protein BWY87_01118 [Deltaproteobacteria bacterium ADurb.Bin510]|nr:MAG: hypothetical protein BWY87_01118 [Deltaproteobacteria bacterium ADurb.Bin510]
MPPIAAMIGKAALRTSASSPTSISRLISSPTPKKKKAIKPSLTQCSKDISSRHGPRLKPSGVWIKCS